MFEAKNVSRSTVLCTNIGNLIITLYNCNFITSACYLQVPYRFVWSSWFSLSSASIIENCLLTASARTVGDVISFWKILQIKKFAKLQICKNLFFACVRQAKSCHLIPMKPKLFLAISKRSSWMGLRMTCHGLQIDWNHNFGQGMKVAWGQNKRSDLFLFWFLQNSWWRHFHVIARSEILSERPLVGCGYTIPCQLRSAFDSDRYQNRQMVERSQINPFFGTFT